MDNLFLLAAEDHNRLRGSSSVIGCLTKIQGTLNKIMRVKQKNSIICFRLKQMTCFSGKNSSTCKDES